MHTAAEVVAAAAATTDAHINVASEREEKQMSAALIMVMNRNGKICNGDKYHISLSLHEPTTIVEAGCCCFYFIFPLDYLFLLWHIY